MKRWVLLTLILYLASISVLTAPLFLANNGDLLPDSHAWLVPILVLMQCVLLLVPMAIIRERPVKKRKVIFSAIIGAIPMAALALGFFVSIALMVWGKNTVDEYLHNWPTLIIPAIAWLVWGMVFYKSFSSQNPNSFTSNRTRWLLRGSILELLVVIPSHIISRHRVECCAPPLTLLGIATGLAIALMSFGPGVLFLFAQRIRTKTGKT